MNQTLTLLRPISIISALCGIILYFTFYLLSSYARNNTIYVAASLDKEYRLEHVTTPRIVFVGGSNLALGLNSQQLSKETGYSVINMGLHAGLGLNFILNETQKSIKPGDIIILSIEHFLGDGNKKLMAQLVDINPSTKSLMNLSYLDRIRLLIAQLQLCISGTFYKLINRDKDPIYNREAFNSYGDLTTHYGQPKPTAVSGNILFSNTDYSKWINVINNFIELAYAKSAKVYFVFPAFQESAYKNNLHTLKALELQYKAGLKCPILGSMTSSVMQDKYFFDTVYHLDQIGSQKRTEIIFNLLKQINMASPIMQIPDKKNIH
ncbi:hypothetical protein GO755_05925 [Spirosoma sp. HMF4905]|uniref:SGNH/GDSL hydrolase family protein n=1 Tax=Spirosoma arboris TaxID=2682092 RepID=A0A7K1S6U8_9BACT|nr:hypothetical protein [Spirosoma arboris]MVM29562.1 hypothetical protein [Spirosoma arboris]